MTFQDEQDKMVGLITFLTQKEKIETRLPKFARESNEIEGIVQNGRHKTHTRALTHFLALTEITLFDLEQFVKEIEPSAFLRTKPEHCVWIGGKEAMRAPESLFALDKLLQRIKKQDIPAYEAHCDYEMIHPFIDGNGRSGRALWLWMMVKSGYDLKYLFLQQFYYSTLQRYRG